MYASTNAEARGKSPFPKKKSRACSQLKLFVLAHPRYFQHPDGSYGFRDGDVLGIATMKQLRHLSLRLRRHQQRGTGEHH